MQFAPHMSNFNQLQKRWADPLITALTVMLAAILFIFAPLQAAGLVAAHQFAIALGFVMAAAVFVVSRSWVAVAAILVAIAFVIIATVQRRHPSLLDIYLLAASWSIVSVTLGFVIGRVVFGPGKVNYHRVIGAVLLYLTIGVMFVALFCFVALSVPNAFNGLGPIKDNLALAGDLIYFSFVTLTTVGYGDIIPVHPLARSLANCEAIIGQLYPATLLARLVTLQIEYNRRQPIQAESSGLG